MVEQRNIFLIGPTGSGKSAVGKQLAQQFNMAFYDSDHEIEVSTGADISWVFDKEGEAGFRKREERIIDALTEKQGIVLATGGGVIELPKNRERLSARGLVIYLATSVDKQLARTQRDKKRPLIQRSADPRKTLERLAEVRNPLYEEIANLTVKTEQQNVKAVASHIVERLLRQ